MGGGSPLLTLLRWGPSLGGLAAVAGLAALLLALVFRRRWAAVAGAAVLGLGLPLVGIAHCVRWEGGGSADNPWFHVEGCGVPAHLIYMGWDGGGGSTAGRFAWGRWLAEAVFVGGLAGAVYYIVHGGPRSE